ncbi:MAG: hypothetical protein HUU29_13205, partial [Planctomycetaceae bacterium]|nr:hypothetical protein [Planctomycetaceae bacterium]
MSKHPTILLVGNQLDSHVKLVSEDIVRMGGTPIVLSMEDASTWLGHSVECDEGGVQTYDTTSKSIIDVTAVWWRRYCKAETAGIPSDAKLPGEEARVFCRGQRHQHFLGAICALPSIVEVNPLWAEWRISTKAVQLRMARDIGFAIPRTYMGADPIAARAFAESCLTSGSAVVSKAHTSVPLPSITHDGRDYGRMTTLLHPERLGELNDLHGTPVILQEYVPKAFEVRATVVGDRVFACGIDSQKSDRTKVDWRRYDLPNTPHWPYDMPKDVERKLLEFCRRAELVFG